MRESERGGGGSHPVEKSWKYRHNFDLNLVNGPRYT